jgi:hypothetical protein
VSFDLADTPSMGSPEHDDDQAPRRVAGRPCSPVATNLASYACSRLLDNRGRRSADSDEGPSPPRVGVAPLCALSMPNRMGAAHRAGPHGSVEGFLGLTARACGVLTSALAVALLLVLLVGSDAGTSAADRPAMGSAGMMHAGAERRDGRGGARVGLVAVAKVIRPTAEPTTKPISECES